MEKPEDFQERWLRWLVIAIPVGLLVILPLYVVLYTTRQTILVSRFLLGQLGRPFGQRWFQKTQHLIWKTNFLAMPPDDAGLAKWLSEQPHVVASSVTREPYWVVFDCVRRGYFLSDELKSDSTAKARELGYDTGPGISITDIKE